MRIILHEYAKEGRTAYEITNDGAEVVRDLDGERKVGERICAFIDLACDDNDKGIDRLVEALEWVTEEIKKRKANPVSV